jgi:hypothetical protein
MAHKPRGALKLSTAGHVSTRATSRAGTNREDPVTPVGPPSHEASLAPTPEVTFVLNRAVPNSPLAARKALVGQNILEKHTDLVTPGALNNILAQLVHRSDTAPGAAVLLQAVVLLLPEAFALSSSLTTKLSDLDEKVTTLLEQSTKLSEQPDTPEPPSKLKELEDKLEKLSEGVAKLQTSAGATEMVAIETQKSMIALSEGLWEQVPARKGVRGAPSNEPAGPSVTGGGRRRPQ